MKTVNDRTDDHPEWMVQAQYWLGAYSNVFNLSDLSCRFSTDTEGELEEGVVELDEWITIEPCEIEQDSITGPVKHRGFEISVTHVSAGGYWHPPEVDVVPVDQYTHIDRAIKEALVLWAKHWMDGIAESIGESNLAREMADLCM